MTNAGRLLFAILGAAAGMVPVVLAGALLVPYVDHPLFFIIPLAPFCGAVLGWNFAERIDEWLNSSR